MATVIGQKHHVDLCLWFGPEMFGKSFALKASMAAFTWLCGSRLRALEKGMTKPDFLSGEAHRETSSRLQISESQWSRGHVAEV